MAAAQKTAPKNFFPYSATCEIEPAASRYILNPSVTTIPGAQGVYCFTIYVSPASALCPASWPCCNTDLASIEIDTSEWPRVLAAQLCARVCVCARPA